MHLRLTILGSNENAPSVKKSLIYNSDINFHSCYFVLLPELTGPWV